MYQTRSAPAKADWALKCVFWSAQRLWDLKGLLQGSEICLKSVLCIRLQGFLGQVL